MASRDLRYRRFFNVEDLAEPLFPDLGPHVSERKKGEPKSIIFCTLPALTINDFNAFVTQQGVGGLNNMHDIVQGFVSSHGYNWGSTKSEVEEAVGSTCARIYDQELLRGAVDATAGEARLRTGGISRESIQPSDGHVPLREPDGTEAIEKMDRLDQFNRREISGEGGIQTTLTGMTQQQVGKRLKGVVDDKRRTPAAAPRFSISCRKSRKI
jgi:hypothetical protein